MVNYFYHVMEVTSKWKYIPGGRGGRVGDGVGCGGFTVIHKKIGFYWYALKQ